MVILDLDDLEAAATKYPYISAIHAPTVLALIAKLREAEAVIAEALELIATVKVAGEVPVDVFAIERILARSKPTNQEGES